MASWQREKWEGETEKERLFLLFHLLFHLAKHVSPTQAETQEND